MAGAGKKLRGGGAKSKRRSPGPQNSGGGYGRPAHPSRIIVGQIFFPTSANGRRRLFVVLRILGDRAHCERLDGKHERFIVSTERLLAQRYTFQGYKSRRYRTWAQVATVDAERATLVVPEWHPGRPVRLPVRQLLVHAREVGTWLEVSADLSAPNAARLQLAPLRACEAPAPEECPEPQWTPLAREHASVMPELGPGCGDIVLETPPVTTGSSKKPHPLSLFVRDRPDGIGSWSRVYLPEGDGVTAWLRAVSTSPSPSGCWVHCEPAAHALAHPVRAGGVREEGMWRWRWWPRSAEDDPNQLARCQYDPVEHRGGWVWRQRAETGR